MRKRTLDALKKELLKRRSELLDGQNQIRTVGLRLNEEDILDTIDLSSSETERDFLLRLRDRERKLLVKIDDALLRIKDGTFGICDSCAGPIDEKRLKARPTASLCIDCKEEQERREKSENIR
jgi:DnaK suppressor protein